MHTYIYIYIIIRPNPNINPNPIPHRLSRVQVSISKTPKEGLQFYNSGQFVTRFEKGKEQQAWTLTLQGNRVPCPGDDTLTLTLILILILILTLKP